MYINQEIDWSVDYINKWKYTSKFACFILSYWRADNVLTYKTLKKCWYTWKIYIIIDDSDVQQQAYIDNFWKENVIIFNKQESWEIFDVMDNFKNFKSVTYARNMCFSIARKLWLDYFLELDDDYNEFSYTFDEDFEFKQRWIKNIDNVFESYLEFLDTSWITCVAFAQRWEFIWWWNWDFTTDMKTKRKIMNSFFCKVDREWQFKWILNDDVNTYVNLWIRWQVVLTTNNVALNQKATQSQEGWLTEIYLEMWTYTKSFYTVMISPSSVKISTLWTTSKRIHHRISWNNTVPKILSEDIKSK